MVVVAARRAAALARVSVAVEPAAVHVGARRGKLLAITLGGAPRPPAGRAERALALARQASVVGVDAWHRVACPRRALRPHRGATDKASADGPAGAVVPEDGLRASHKVERRALEALLSQRGVGGAEAVLVPAAVVEPHPPRHRRLGACCPARERAARRRQHLGAEVAHPRKVGREEDAVAPHRRLLVLAARLSARVDHGSGAGRPPRVEAVRVVDGALDRSHVHRPVLARQNGRAWLVAVRCPEASLVRVRPAA
mmetsp:Transcript_41788/g.135107  ORF Transcript_41788/g.135107 Transcript_41788/m.135107 type:complete len:255 (-) Transcript_41788:470-1234(-)